MPKPKTITVQDLIDKLKEVADPTAPIIIPGACEMLEVSDLKVGNNTITVMTKPSEDEPEHPNAFLLELHI